MNKQIFFWFVRLQCHSIQTCVLNFPVQTLQCIPCISCSPYYFCISCIPCFSCTPCIPCIFCISKCCWLGLTCLLRISCSPHPAPRLPSNPASAMFAQLSFIAGQNLFGHTRWRERVGGLEGTNYSLQWIFHTEANPLPNHCEQIWEKCSRLWCVWLPWSTLTPHPQLKENYTGVGFSLADCRDKARMTIPESSPWQNLATQLPFCIISTVRCSLPHPPGYHPSHPSTHPHIAYGASSVICVLSCYFFFFSKIRSLCFWPTYSWPPTTDSTGKHGNFGHGLYLRIVILA